MAAPGTTAVRDLYWRTLGAHDLGATSRAFEPNGTYTQHAKGLRGRLAEVSWEGAKVYEGLRTWFQAFEYVTFPIGFVVSLADPVDGADGSFEVVFELRGHIAKALPGFEDSVLVGQPRTLRVTHRITVSFDGRHVRFKSIRASFSAASYLNR